MGRQGSTAPVSHLKDSQKKVIIIVLIISILKFGQPVADERKRELLQTPVIVLDNVAQFHEAVMVFLDELLVLGVLEVVLRHCVHVTTEVKVKNPLAKQSFVI